MPSVLLFCRYLLLNLPVNALHTIFPYKSSLPLCTNLKSEEYSPQPNSLNLRSRIWPYFFHNWLFYKDIFQKQLKNTVFRPYQNAPFLCLRPSHLLSLHLATKGCISLDAYFNEEFDKPKLEVMMRFIKSGVFFRIFNS